MFDVTLIKDETANGVRRTTFLTCPEVCSEIISIETQGDTIRSVQYVKGCHGNTQGIGSLCAGMKVSDVITRLEGIDCHGRGTSCPDQLARALKQL
ncbi:MAG: TIGR03905 family TSCPD domain-containing protein [Bacteroidaceae bacterium]|nr:TIGR03905 family TSCPD domain-containing protein [Bacteroidaceae bacterium]